MLIDGIAACWPTSRGMHPDQNPRDECSRAAGLQFRVVHQVLLGHAFAGELARDAAPAEGQDAVGVGEDQFRFRRGEHHRRTVALLPGDQFHDLGLGVNIHAARGLFQQQHADRAEQPLGEHDLLLIASRQRTGAQRGVWRTAADSFEQRPADAMFAAARDPRTECPRQMSQRGVVGNRGEAVEAAGRVVSVFSSAADSRISPTI